ncbi:Gfo/Idh/MocA family oxidoreductase [Exiguobacterium aestuarii]|uniref:Gfo/Idh/MocA family oxidoreductase n=1 Tax=Exiguobacterium aestuarii TaxID=273527 RepID=A0ABW2PP79_9BACL|nr:MULTISPECIES: Gfo/Idh/MocA family oxidoreductase [Exiguobacterium]MCT4786578.1 Gfo/Idh/MocA family oxidoreductase [Exiguobacterium aestuarii]
MIKTVLVGFGFSANTFHLPFLKAIDTFEVSGVVSSRPEEVQGELPGATVYASLEEALQSDATLYVITTPSHLHKEMIVDCLKAGKDVLVEKPAFLTTEEGYELMELEAKSRGIVNVYQNRRYDGDFLTIKSLLDSNELGDWKVVESRFDRFRPNVRDRWRENAGPGAGILFDLGSHLIDQTLALFGKPDKIQADVMIQREGGQSDDGFYVTFYYGEKRVYLRSNPFIAGETPRFEVHGTKGSFMKFGLDPQEEALKQGKLASDVLETGILSTDEVETIQVEKGSYFKYYEQLAESYQTRQPIISLKDATLTTHLIELARQSSETGQVMSVD